MSMVVLFVLREVTQLRKKILGLILLHFWNDILRLWFVNCNFFLFSLFESSHELSLRRRLPISWFQFGSAHHLQLSCSLLPQKLSSSAIPRVALLLLCCSSSAPGWTEIRTSWVRSFRTWCSLLLLRCRLVSRPKITRFAFLSWFGLTRSHPASSSRAWVNEPVPVAWPPLPSSLSVALTCRGTQQRALVVRDYTTSSAMPTMLLWTWC